jgi:MOSC domain-containing protein YiiM
VISTPRVLATSRSSAHGFSKQPQASIFVLANEGVEGDAHSGRTAQHLYLKRKNAAAPNLCQVHLFASEMLDELAAQGFSISPGDLGENLLTRGVDLIDLPLGTRLRIGSDLLTSSILEVTGLRTPCSQIDAFRPGLQSLLYGPPLPGEDKRSLRAGIMTIVLRSGSIHPNDLIQVALPLEPHQALGPV